MLQISPGSGVLGSLLTDEQSLVVEVSEVPLLQGVALVTLHQPELEGSSGDPETAVGLLVSEEAGVRIVGPGVLPVTRHCNVSQTVKLSSMIKVFHSQIYGLCGSLLTIF